MATAYQSDGMTIKQKLFCVNYLSNGYNGTEAVMNSGYSPSNRHVAKNIAAENMAKPAIKKYLEVRMKEAIEEAGVGVKWRLDMLRQATEACMNGAATKEGYVNAEGLVKTVSEINKMAGDHAAVKTENDVKLMATDMSSVDGHIDKYTKDA